MCNKEQQFQRNNLVDLLFPELKKHVAEVKKKQNDGKNNIVYGFSFSEKA